MTSLLPFRGCWRSRGYGWLLQIDGDHFALFHESANCLVAGESGNADAFARCFDRVRCDSETMSLHHHGDLTTYHFERIDALPRVPVYRPGEQHDADTNFDYLWQLFEQHYAFFELHGVDWRAVGEAYDAAGAKDLWSFLADVLQRFDDGHISLSSDPESITNLRYPGLRRALQPIAGMPGIAISPRSTVDAVHERFDALLLEPFSSTRSPLRDAGNQIIHWCELKPGIAYINVLRLFGFADSETARCANDLPDDRRELGPFLDADMAALDAALDSVFSDIAGARGLVLDIRINGGGFDRAGKLIAERLTTTPTLAWQKQARAGDGFNSVQRVSLQPDGAPGFDGPVVALTSPLCLSAGEILALCLRALPQVTLAGMSTAGMLSDNLIKPLPNGWLLSLSNEIYLSHDDCCFEHTGVPPDIALTTLSEADCAGALHRALIDAVALLETRL